MGEGWIELNKRSCLSGWLRAVQKCRGYISDVDFASILRDESDCNSSDRDAPEPDQKSTHVCVGLTCALRGAEEFCQSLVDAGAIRDHAITFETCAGRCWRAPVVVRGGGVQSGAGDTGDFGEAEEFEQYCSSGGYGVLRSCLAKRRNVEGVISALSSRTVGHFERADASLGARIKDLRARDASVRLLMLIDEDRPGEIAQSFFLSQFPHRVLEGLLIVAYAAGSSEIILYYTRRHEDVCREFRERFLTVRGRGLGLNLQFTLIDADRQSEQQSLKQICFSSNNQKPGVFALVADPEFLAWIPEIVSRDGALHADAPDGAPTLYALLGCVSRPGIYKAPAASSVSELIAIAGGIKAGETLHSFVPGDWSNPALPAHHGHLRVDADVLAQTRRMTFPIVFISQNDNLRRQIAFRGSSH